MIELGKLLLASKKNNNNTRKIEDIKKKLSNNRVFLIIKARGIYTEHRLILGIKDK